MTKQNELNQSIWPISSVESEPKTIIVNWSVFEATFKNGSNKSHHLLGDIPDQYGRVTSAIQQFNSATRAITTRSGRSIR